MIAQPLPGQSVDHWLLPPAYRRASDAITKAHKLWPGVHAQIITEEIHTGWTQLTWLGPKARTVQLIEDILATPEPTS